MIRYINGDIFKSDSDVIIHGCNCLHTMGAGIALTVKKLYPEAYIADKRTIFNDSNKLGLYSKWTGECVYNSSKTVTIINAYTQYYPHPPFDYEALRRVLPKIKEVYPNNIISTCKIGCGLAGGDWNKVSKIIEECFNDKEIRVYLI